MPRFLILVAVLIHCFLFAQNSRKAEIKFEKTTYDFGTIKETEGIVECVFNFSNLGNAPLIIQKVQASCGCTTPSWNKDTIMPGKTGVIKAGFNSKNRPGAFNKTITVVTNTNPGVQVLTIMGVVVPMPTTIEDELPEKNGAIRLLSRSINMGTVLTDKPITKEFAIYNDSDSIIVFQDSMHLPPHIHVMVEPDSIKPKTKAKLIITYDGMKKGDFGFVNDFVSLYTNEPNPIKNLNVYATIEEYFPVLTAQELLRAPRARFAKKENYLGRIGDSAPVTSSFLITNIGKKNLIIRKTKPSCPCVTAEADKNLLKPGESTNIKVIFDPKGKEGLNIKTVTVFSNDPSNPVQMLTIKADIFK